MGSRFGVPLSKLASPVVPALRKGCGEAVRFVTEVKYLDHGHISPDIETDERGLRKRRTYEEVRGTEGFKIIEAAGLVEFPPLTQKQKELVAVRERQAREENAIAESSVGEIRARSRAPERVF